MHATSDQFKLLMKVKWFRRLLCSLYSLRNVNLKTAQHVVEWVHEECASVHTVEKGFPLHDEVKHIPSIL